MFFMTEFVVWCACTVWDCTAGFDLLLLAKLLVVFAGLLLFGGLLVSFRVGVLILCLIWHML